MRDVLIVGWCLIGGLCVGCAPQKPQKSGAQVRVVSGREAEAVIEVGSEEFSVDEVQSRLAELRGALPGAEASDTQLGVIAEFELLADEAERRGYGKDPRVVNAVKDALAEAVAADKRVANVADAVPSIDEAALNAAFEAGRKRRK